MILYNYYRSSASYRVRIALNLKGIAYEYRPVHLLKDGGEQLKSDYASLNPSREVPTLIHAGQTIAQSMAIIDYLDYVIAEPALFPLDPFKRALTIQACEIVNSGTQPLGNLKVLNDLGSRFGADSEAKTAWIHHWVTEGLTALEAHVAKHAGRFCIGDEVTAADCFLVPQLFSAERFKVPVSPYKTLLKIRKECEQLPAFQKAAPNVQPDTPADAT